MTSRESSELQKVIPSGVLFPQSVFIVLYHIPKMREREKTQSSTEMNWTWDYLRPVSVSYRC